MSGEGRTFFLVAMGGRRQGVAMTGSWPRRWGVRGVAVAGLLSLAGLRAEWVLPELVDDLACHYDFEQAGGVERDLGFSATPIELVNGGENMRVDDGAHAGSRGSIETAQVDPEAAGNDDWKAGVFQPDGVAALAPFGSLAGITIMGWVKPTGRNPSPDSNTPEPGDFFRAVGLFGLLSGDSEGHGVRALLEVIQVSGTLRLVALGRRLDGGLAQTLAADDDWETLLPADEWSHLTACFDFDEGRMALYRNGRPLEATPVRGGDPWQVLGEPEPDLTSAGAPAGIKIGGSFPQNSYERNPFNGRFDELMFFTRALEAAEVLAQFRHFPTGEAPRLGIECAGGMVTLRWPATALERVLESSTDLGAGGWGDPGVAPVREGEEFRVSLPIEPGPRFFRLADP